MGIWKRKKRADPAQEPEVDAAILRAWLSGESVGRERAVNIPSLAGCLNKIAGTVAAVPIRMYKRETNRITEVLDDNRIVLLNSETGDTLDAYQMKRAVILDYFLGRGGYIFIDKVKNEIRSLRYVSEKNISFNENPDVIFKDYDILVQGNTYKPYQFIRLLRNTEDGAKGKSIIEENEGLLRVAYNSLKFEETLVSTGGNKKGFIKSPRKLSQAAIDALKDAWRNLYSNNTESVVILNEDNGAVIPSSIVNKIIEKVVEICPIYSMADRYNIGGTISIPFYDEDTSSIKMAYADEFTELTSTSGTWAEVITQIQGRC